MKDLRFLRWCARARRIGLIALAAISLNVMTAGAATIVVTTNADGIDAGGGGCGSVSLGTLPGPNGVTSLREAICAANNNAGTDTITFAVNGLFLLTGAANEDTGNSGDLDIRDNLVIQGNGEAATVISGNHIERVFDFLPSAASTFELTGLTVAAGDTRTNTFKLGGAMYLHNNVTTTITLCTIRDNYSGASGAIANRGTLTVNSSIITQNPTVPSSGSTLGGGIHSTGPLTIFNTTISENRVQGEGGGVAVGLPAGVTATITDSTFSGNFAIVSTGGIGNGGGLTTTGNEGTVNVTNCTFSGNRAVRHGGGAYFTSPGGAGSAIVTNVTFTNNIADNDNADIGFGGGLARGGGSVTLRNTLVAGNFNTASPVRDDISGPFVNTSSFNLIGDGTGSSGLTNGTNGNQVGSPTSAINPVLGPLTMNGGATETHALLTSSPAIDRASNANAPAEDQRGVPRPLDGDSTPGAIADIGAYEVRVVATGAYSRKPHGGSITYHVDLPLTGAPGLECRTGGATNDYDIVVTFTGGVNVTGSPRAEVIAGSAIIGSGGVSNGGNPNIGGNSLSIPLTNVTSQQTIQVRLNGVNGSNSVVIPMRVLVGDATGDGIVNSGDTITTRNRSGQSVDATNFRTDYNTDGTINSGDTTVVRSRSGQFIP